MWVTVAVVIVAVAGVTWALKREVTPPSTSAGSSPERFDRAPTGPELPPTGDPDLDQLLRDAQNDVREKQETFRRIEDRTRRLEADLARARLEKTAADRAKAESDAAIAAMKGEPGPK